MASRNKKIIPNSLRKHRRLLGFSQKDIQKHLRLQGTSMISRWEQGVTMPSGEYLLQLSILYKTLVNELYYELGKEYQQQLFPQEYEDAVPQKVIPKNQSGRGP